MLTLVGKYTVGLNQLFGIPVMQLLQKVGGKKLEEKAEKNGWSVLSSDIGNIVRKSYD